MNIEDNATYKMPYFLRKYSPDSERAMRINMYRKGWVKIHKWTIEESRTVADIYTMVVLEILADNTRQYVVDRLLGAAIKMQGEQRKLEVNQYMGWDDVG